MVAELIGKNPYTIASQEWRTRIAAVALILAPFGHQR